MNHKTIAITLLLGLAAHTKLQAEAMTHHQGHDMSQMGEMSTQTEMVMTKGVITRLDDVSGKVGIKHETIANLKMPPMTMVFVTADPTLLKGIKVGDAVTFHAENQQGKLTVTAIQPH